MKKLLLIIPFLLIGLASCDSINFDDSINADEDAITSPNTQSLMAGAMNDFFTLAFRNYYQKPMLYSQYLSQYQYIDEMCYGVEQGGWTAWYANDLKNLEKIIAITTADKVPAIVKTFGAPVNQAGVAKLFSAFIWKRVTDAYGPVPFKKALTDSVLTPPYTPQKEIYHSLVDMVQEARDMLDPSKDGPTGDVVYGGNVMDWKKFANSFLMSLAIQMSEADPAYAASVFKEAYTHPAGYIDDFGEEMWYNYQPVAGMENPISVTRGADYSVSKTLVSAMKGTSDDISTDAFPNGTIADPAFSSDTYDPRLDVYVIDATLEGRPYGLLSQVSDQGPYTEISLAMGNKAGAPIHYMTAAYTMLNIAEAAALGWIPGGTAKAKAMLHEAIVMSFKTMDDHYGSSISDKAAAFADARVADAAVAPGGVLQVIREEKWVSLFPRSWQPWAEWRRTGVPGLIAAQCATNTNGEIPERYQYPSEEAGNNKEAYKGGVSLLEPTKDVYYAKFWWNQ